jgi:hypothetical protein
MNQTSRRLARAALTAAVCAASFTATAAGPDPRNLTGEWWQWAVSIPVAANPMLDASGGNCMVGQHGDTWFLAGGFGGGTASRTCKVPEGVTLFFPATNSVNFDTPGVCGQVGRLSVADLRGYSASFIDSLKQTSVTLDSRPVRTRRIRSDVFPLVLPVENVFTAPPDCLVPADVYPRAVDDGIYASIDGLTPGEHIVQIAASNGGNFNLNVTYRLIVVPRDRR